MKITTARSWAAFAVLSLVAVPVAAQQEPELKLTLDQAVTRALRVSPSMAQAEGSVRSAESGERSAWGAFLPNLSLSSGASLSSTERFNPQTNTTVSGSNDSYSAGLSASYDLFTAGRRGAELRRTRAQTNFAEAGMLESRYAVTLQVKTAYFNVLRSDEQIRVAQAGVTRAEEGLGAAERRTQVGNATRSDQLRASLELTQAQQTLLQAQNSRRNAAYELGRLVGESRPVGADEQLPLAPEPLALSDAELVALVVNGSPNVKTAEASLASAEASLRSSRTQYFPTLRTSWGYDWFNQDAALSGGRTSWSGRLSLSYPLFNNFSREDAIARAAVQVNNAEYVADDARRTVRASLERLIGALRLAEAQITLSGQAVAVAEEDLRVQEERYRLGVTTILDRITSQQNLIQAELNLVSARFDYQIARAELEALVGREL